MKRISLAFFSLCLLFCISSCGDDPVIDNGGNAGADLFVGKVLNSAGVGLQGVNVDFYQSGKKLGTATSNDQGDYNTSGIDLDKNQVVNAHLSHTGYLEILNVMDLNENDKPILTLYNKEEAKYSTIAIAEPGAEFVKVTGSIFTDQENPASAHVVVYDSEQSSFQNYSGQYTRTDEHGAYALFIPKGSKAVVRAVQTQCYEHELYELSFFEPAMALGDILEEHTVAPIYTASEVELRSRKFTGRAYCGTELLPNTTLQVKVQSITVPEPDEEGEEPGFPTHINFHLADVVTDAEGKYSVEFEDCGTHVQLFLASPDGFFVNVASTVHDEVESPYVNVCQDLTLPLSGSAVAKVNLSDFTVFNSHNLTLRRNAPYYVMGDGNFSIQFDVLSKGFPEVTKLTYTTEVHGPNFTPSIFTGNLDNLVSFEITKVEASTIASKLVMKLRNEDGEEAELSVFANLDIVN